MMDSNWLLLKLSFPSDLSIIEELKQWCLIEPRQWLVSFYIWWHLLSWQEIPVLWQSHPPKSALVSSADATVLRRLKYLCLRSHSDTVWSGESEHFRSKMANVEYQFIPLFFSPWVLHGTEKLRTSQYHCSVSAHLYSTEHNFRSATWGDDWLKHFLGQISPSRPTFAQILWHFRPLQDRL